MGLKSRFAAGAHEHAAQFVRDGIRDGRWRPGETLEATALAAELGISASPVREAFARLRGERLLEARHRGGYSIPMLQPHELESEYRLMSLLAMSLATRPLEPRRAPRSSPAAYGERVDGLLTALARTADLPAAAGILHNSALLLGPYLRAEPLFIPHAEQSVAEMEILFDAGDAGSLTSSIERHFGRCIAAAPNLARYVFERAKRFEKEFE